MREQRSRSEDQQSGRRLGRRAVLGSGAGLMLAACQQLPLPVAPAARLDATPTVDPPVIPTGGTRPPLGDESGTPRARELARAESWFAHAFQASDRVLPISFRYADREAASIVPNWPAQWASEQAERGATHHTLTLSDPDTGLCCQCKVTT